MEEITERLTAEIMRTVEQLLHRHPVFVAHERFTHDRLSELAYRAYQRGAHEALLSLRDSQQAAVELGISRRQVQTYARQYGLGWRTSTGRDIIFRPDDIAFMRERIGQVGRPRIRELNDDGRG